MTYIPSTAANWVDEGPNLRPANGPTEAVSIGINTLSGAELFRLAGAGLIEDTFTITGTGKHLVLDGTWDGSHILIRGNHVWIDDANRCRINSIAPTSQDDGEIIGLQSE